MRQLLKKVMGDKRPAGAQAEMKILDCSGTKHEIWVTPGQAINERKMCKRLKTLENNKYKHEQKKHNSQNGY